MTGTTDRPGELLTLHRVAQILCLPPSRVLELTESSGLRAVRVRVANGWREMRWHECDLVAWLNQPWSDSAA